MRCCNLLAQRPHMERRPRSCTTRVTISTDNGGFYRRLKLPSCSCIVRSKTLTAMIQLHRTDAGWWREKVLALSEPTCSMRLRDHFGSILMIYVLTVLIVTTG
jgi:hypothetical protein